MSDNPSQHQHQYESAARDTPPSCVSPSSGGEPSAGIASEQAVSGQRREQLPVLWQPRRKFGAFISHCKADVADQARFLHEELERLLRFKVFFDAENLLDLRELQQHVRDSDVLLLLLTKNFLERPWCLIEVYTAMQSNVHLLPINVIGKAYNFAQAAHFLANLDSELARVNPHGPDVLREHGFDIRDVGQQLSRVVPNRIASAQLDFSAHRDIREVQLRHIANKMADILEVPRSPGVEELDLLRSLLEPLAFAADTATEAAKFVEGTREWVFNLLHEWRCARSASQCYVLLGDPGFGKTALVARLCTKWPALVLGVHLCRHDNAEKRDARRMVKSLAFQLAEKVPEYRAALSSLLRAGPLSPTLTARELADKLLVQLLHDVARPEAVVDGRALLVIDALDEAEREHKNELAAVLATEFKKLPAWLGVVATSRPERPLKEKLATLRPVELNAAEHRDECERDTHTFLECVLAPYVPPQLLETKVALAAGKAAGVFLYLHWLRERVEQEGNAKVLDALPEGLGGVYEVQFTRLLEHGLPEEGDERSVLEAIVAMPVPLHAKEELPALCGVPKCKRLLEQLSTLFPLDADGRVYVFHKSIVDWLTGAPPQYKDRDDEDPFYVSLAAGHARLARSCAATLCPLLASTGTGPIGESDGLACQALQKLQIEGVAHAPEAYALRWAVHHLLEAGEGEATMALLCSRYYVHRHMDSMEDSHLEDLVANCERALWGSRDARLLRDALTLSSSAVRRGAALDEQLWQRLWEPSEAEDASAKASHAAPYAAALARSCRAAMRAATCVLTARDPHLQAAGGAALLAALEGHTDPVMCVCSLSLSDGSTRIVSGSSDHSVRVWDAAAGGAALAVLEGHTNGVTCVCSVSLSNGSARIVSGSADRTVRVWDAETGGTALAVLEGHTNGVTCVCSVSMSDGSTRIVSGSSDRTVRVWDAAAGGAALVVLQGHTHDVTCMCSLSLSDGSARIVSCSKDSTVRVWDAVEGAAVSVLDEHTTWVTCVCSVSLPNGSVRIVSGSRDGTVRVWDAAAGGEALAVLQGHTHWVTCVCSVALPDGCARIVSGSADQTVRVWDASAGGEALAVLEGHTDWVRCMCGVSLSDGSARIVSGSEDCTVLVWDAAGGGKALAVLEGHTGWVTCVCSVSLSDGSARIVSGNNDCSVRVWDVSGGRATFASLQKRTDAVVYCGVAVVTCVCSVLLSDGSARIVSGSRDGTVSVWDMAVGSAALAVLEGHTSAVCCVCSVPMSDGSTRVVSGSSDCTVRVWDAAAGGTAIAVLKGHTDRVACVCSVLLPDGSARIVSGSADQTVRVWDAAAGGEALAVLEGHTDWVKCVCIVSLPDGPGHVVSGSDDGTERIASGSDDGTVRVWDAAAGGAALVVLEGHTGAVNSVCSVSLSDRSARIVSGGSDRTVRVWDAAAGGAALAFLCGHTDWVTCVCNVLLADGSVRIVSSSKDHTVRVWDTNTWRLCMKPHVCQTAIRALTSLSAGHPQAPRLPASSLPDILVVACNDHTRYSYVQLEFR